MWDPRLRFLEKISTTQFLLGWQVHVVICTIISSVCHERLISHLTSPTRPLTWGVSLPQCQHVCDHYILAGKSLATRDPPQPKRKLSPFCPRGFCLFIGSISCWLLCFVIYAVTFLLCALVTDEFRIFAQNSCSGSSLHLKDCHTAMSLDTVEFFNWPKTNCRGRLQNW